MNSRTHIRDKKRMVSVSAWATGPIAAKNFPLFKDKSEVGPAWEWRSAKLESDTAFYRLLVQLRSDKPNFKAWLAVQIGNDWALISRLESHMHAGLHCHLQCPENGIEVNQIDPPGALSIPFWKAHHRRPNKVLSQMEAWNMALRFFRVEAAIAGSLGL